jgi:hypothetical protein
MLAFPVRTNSSMPFIFTTGLKQPEWLAGELVVMVTGAGMLDVSGDTPAPGPLDGLCTAVVDVGSTAVGAVLSVKPEGVPTVRPAPV